MMFLPIKGHQKLPAASTHLPQRPPPAPSSPQQLGRGLERTVPQKEPNLLALTLDVQPPELEQTMTCLRASWAESLVTAAQETGTVGVRSAGMGGSIKGLTSHFPGAASRWQSPGNGPASAAPPRGSRREAQSCSGSCPGVHPGVQPAGARGRAGGRARDGLRGQRRLSSLAAGRSGCSLTPGPFEKDPRH